MNKIENEIEKLDNNTSNIGKMLWLTNSQPQTVAANTTVKMNFDTIYEDTSNGSLTLNNYSIKVGPNIKTLLIEIQYRMNNAADITEYLYMYKNDVSLSGSAYMSTSTNTNSGPPSICAAIPVQEGDIITVAIRGSSNFTTFGARYAAWDYFKATILN